MDHSGNVSYNMDGTTYKYDEVGNVNDDAAQNLTMAWTPQNKLLNTTGPDIKTEYLYYGDGNLTRKYITGVTYDEFGKKVPEDRYIFYIRDASGNLIGLYETDLLATTPTFDVKERYIYGTEMLAVMKGENSGESVPDLEYMLKDHLGNVRVMLGENGTKYPSTLDIKSYNNNYAFGAPHPFRNFNLLDQRHAFNGQEKPNEIKGVGLHYSFGARRYDPVYGRWWSREPLFMKYPQLSPYSFSGNSPIKFKDYDGRDFGMYVNHNDQTIIIRMNQYTLNDKHYAQIANGIKELENLTGTVMIDGVEYSFKFIVEAKPPSPFAYIKALQDPIGNFYFGTVDVSKAVLDNDKITLTGGVSNGWWAQMRMVVNPRKWQDPPVDMGNYPEMVNHEVLHEFGLEDAAKREYYSPDGRMKYTATPGNNYKMQPISATDIGLIIAYGFNSSGRFLNGQNKEKRRGGDAAVDLKEVGTPKGENTNRFGIRTVEGAKLNRGSNEQR